MGNSIGVGTIYLMLAGIATIVSNYLVSIGVARLLGPELYGVYGVLMSLYLINRAFLNTGLPKAVSRFISGSEKNIGEIFRFSFKLQFVIAIVFALVYILFSSVIASTLNDSSLKYYIMFLGITIIPLSLLAMNLSGFINGLRLFKIQAKLKILLPTLKIFFVFSFLLLGYKLWGALIGYFISVLLTLLLSQYFLKRYANKVTLKTTKSGFYKKVLIFSAPLTVAAFGFALLRHINILFIKSLLQDNLAAGLYNSAFILSNAPFMVFSALPFTLLPSVSKSVSDGNIILTKKYISNSLRGLLLLLLPITLIISATSKNLITLFFTDSYSLAAPILQVLIFSSGILVIFKTLNSIITGIGKPKLEMVAVIVMFLFLSILNIFLIPSLGILGAAYSSLITSLIALGISASYVFYRFRILIKISSLIRITICSLIIFFIALLTNFSGIYLIFHYAFLFLIYFILLYLFGEIKSADWNLFRKIFNKKKVKT